jgi:branched-subunit amino acid transport protein
VGFVVDKVALGQVSLRILQFVSVSIIPPMFLPRVSFIY